MFVREDVGVSVVSIEFLVSGLRHGDEPLHAGLRHLRGEELQVLVNRLEIRIWEWLDGILHHWCVDLYLQISNERGTHF